MQEIKNWERQVQVWRNFRKKSSSKWFFPISLWRYFEYHLRFTTNLIYRTPYRNWFKKTAVQDCGPVWNTGFAPMESSKQTKTIHMIHNWKDMWFRGRNHFHFSWQFSDHYRLHGYHGQKTLCEIAGNLELNCPGNSRIFLKTSRLL